MADFLTAIRTTVQEESEKKPDAVLTALSSRQTQDNRSKAPVRETLKNHPDTVNEIQSAGISNSKHLTTPEETLQLLRSQPDTESLLHGLNILRSHNGFSLHTPGPLQAQITNSLISNIIPSFWSTLLGKDQELLLECLRTVAGTSALIARIRLLSESAGKNSAELIDLLAFMTELFTRDDYALLIWTGLVDAVPEDMKRKMVWKESVSMIGSGKIVATIARAEDALQAADVSVKASWLAKGAEYAAWLGRCVARLTVALSVHDPAASGARDEGASQLFQKGFGMGYSVPLVKAFFQDLIQISPDPAIPLKGLCCNLPSFTRRQFLETTLQWLSMALQSSSSIYAATERVNPVAAVGALLSLTLHSQESFSHHLLSYLSDPAISSTLSITVRRSCLAALDASFPDSCQTLLEKSMSTFGDSLFINHAPTLQQESLAQTILLAAGHIHRRSSLAVLAAARSSGHMQGVSSRLDSTNSKARWLGMVVGTAISSLVDKEGSKMDFGTDELDTDESRWYLQLVRDQDTVGTLSDVKALLESQSEIPTARRRPEYNQRVPMINGKPVFGPPRPPALAQTEVVGEKISEILDGDSEDDDDLRPYAKPDSDPEDSDEDATLVQRNKPRPPVYIRDLMRMLHDDKDPARFQLGITHAATLIRRKAGFGKEVTDHAEELAGILCNLQDPFSTNDFDQLRLQALIAVLLADVKNMAPWMSAQAFMGDYSISQRCVILSTLGLGGRELAGLKNLDELAPVPSGTEFPSKRLPRKLHGVYAPTTESLDKATVSLEHKMIAPLALSAADKTTQHLDAVKVRTFSSRMEVQSRTKRNAPANSLAKCFPETFFAPLIGRYQQEIAAYGQGSIYATTPFLLVTFVKTLALLLHAAGPATKDLGDVVGAFWGVLLGLRVKASGDISVLEAVLFSMLTILEVVGEGVGGKERLAREFSRELGETKIWVEGVFERTGGGGLVEEAGGEEGRVRRLAAGVLVRIGDVGEEWQKILTGRT